MSNSILIIWNQIILNLKEVLKQLTLKICLPLKWVKEILINSIQHWLVREVRKKRKWSICNNKLKSKSLPKTQLIKMQIKNSTLVIHYNLKMGYWSRQLNLVLKWTLLNNLQQLKVNPIKQNIIQINNNKYHSNKPN